MRLLKSTTLTLAIVAFLISFTTSAQDQALTVIGNQESVPDALNMKQLKSVFRGEKLKWDDGSSIKIALMKITTPIGTSTCEKVYGMSGNELNKYFLALVFQGKAKAPTFFNSIEELENYVAQTPGAIGVSADTPGSNVKTVTVDGNKQL